MTDLVVAGSFQDKIFAKIKESIGDLMTDEDLKRLVEAAMQDAFFKERRISAVYGREDVKPPLLVELINSLLRERIVVAIDEWLAAHKDDVLKLINERITAGAIGLLASAFDLKMSYAFQQFGDQVRNAMVNR